MKALSIKQPWAFLIIHGFTEHEPHQITIHQKNIENRNWKTKFRGRFLVHASKQVDRVAMRKFIDKGLNPDDLRRGEIIGSVDLIDVVTESDSHWFDGPIGFVLKDPIAFNDPIPWKGQLGFWECGLSNAVILRDGKKEVVDIKMVVDGKQNTTTMQTST